MVCLLRIFKIRDSHLPLFFRFNVPWLEKAKIVASNDINEDTLLSLNQQVEI